MSGPYQEAKCRGCSRPRLIALTRCATCALSHIRSQHKLTGHESYSYRIQRGRPPEYSMEELEKLAAKERVI